MELLAYAAINKNEDIRSKSSSGAVFYELAEFVINKQGVVFGAKYDDEWNVVHGHANTIDEVKLFLGSKYVQSKVGNEYRYVKQYLNEGKIVLFSGTPCQIGGLYSFLGRAYDNLITVDFICHGVPSPEVWRSYLANLNSSSDITAVNFRNKDEGWLKFSLKIDFNNGDIYRKNQFDDLYMKGFLQNIYLRPSCYDCKFKGIKRQSDITLADFWGIQENYPDMFDDKGTSLLLVNSQKGNEIWKNINSKFTFISVDFEKALCNNSNAFKSVDIPVKRQLFFEKGINDFHNLDRLTKKPLKSEIKNKIVKIFKIMGWRKK